MLSRKLQLTNNNSFFVFGARGVGKSTLMKAFFANTHVFSINLLHVGTRNRYMDNPDSLELEIPDKVEWVLIDEIQKVPELLDVVHRLIEDKGLKFALTGSSARKLKHGGANLLAGRAFVYNLYPFTHVELGSQFVLEEALMWGTLPKIFSLSSVEDKREFLLAYGNTYLQEEVWEAHLIKDLVPYRRFLKVAAQTNGTVINFSNLAEDCRVDTKTVQRYFQILEETLLGFFLQPFHRSLRKRQRDNPKFYFFDVGVQRALLHDFSLEYGRGAMGFGNRFEHFVIQECQRLNDYYRRGYELSFIRQDEKHEVDLVLSHANGRLILVEIKSSDQIRESHVESIVHIGKQFPEAELYVWSLDETEKKIGQVRCLPWQLGLKMAMEY